MESKNKKEEKGNSSNKPASKAQGDQSKKAGGVKEQNAKPNSKDGNVDQRKK